MKKILSAVLSAAVTISSFTVFSTTAEADSDKMTITILGDSIASGYGLSENEYNYGQIIGDYYDAKVNNFAVSGYRTIDTINQIKNFSSEQKAQFADSDVVVISLGGNDMFEYASAYLLMIADNINALKNGYTAADIPESPSFGDLQRMLDLDAFKAYAENTKNALAIGDQIQELRVNLTATKDTTNYQLYDRVIETRIIPNLETIVSEIKTAAPDARIVLQNVYNPCQFTKEFENENFTGSYKRVMGQVKTLFNLVTKSFSDQIKTIDGVEIADVLTDFSSYYKNEDTSDEYRYGWYFTSMQAAKLEDMDFHPNQAGHLAIASVLINTIGVKNEGGELLGSIFGTLPDYKHYPDVAYATYKKAMGSREIVDPSQTTTTTTTTTTATTTVTTATTTTTTTTKEPDKFADVMLGDIDGNKKVDASDASKCLEEYSKVSTGKPSGFNELQNYAGDVDGNGKVDASDASAILVHYSFVSTGKVPPAWKKNA